MKLLLVVGRRLTEASSCAGLAALALLLLHLVPTTGLLEAVLTAGGGVLSLAAVIISEQQR